MIYCFRVVISYSTLLLRIVISLCVNAPLCRRRAFSQMKLVTVRDFSSVSKVTPGHPKTISSSLVHTSPHRQNDSFLFIFFWSRWCIFFSFCHVYNIETEMIQPQDLRVYNTKRLCHSRPSSTSQAGDKTGLVWIGDFYRLSVLPGILLLLQNQLQTTTERNWANILK